MGSGGSEGFTVKPDELRAIAETIMELHDDVNGNNRARGSLYDFRENAQTQHIISALSSVDPNIQGDSAPWVEAYKNEYDGMIMKYEAMAQNLSELAQKCRKTADDYDKQDDETARSAGAVGAGGDSPVPSGDAGGL